MTEQGKKEILSILEYKLTQEQAAMAALMTEEDRLNDRLRNLASQIAAKHELLSAFQEEIDRLRAAE